MKPPKLQHYEQLLWLALTEDMGPDRVDVTSAVTIPAHQQGAGELVFREPGILCGMVVINAVLACYDSCLLLEAKADDGASITTGTSVALLRGPLRSLLAAERVMLNFLQRLSAIATLTARYVKAVADTQAQICDTRKTTPGWRGLEKYAVRCGGGQNHRQGLYDAVLIKDNHLAALGARNLREALQRAVALIEQQPQGVAFVEVEVDSLEQIRTVLEVDGIDMILLDNMTPEQMTEAVHLRDASGRKDQVQLEASGQITLETVARIAQTGVERISVGALTHSVSNLDIGLDLRQR